MGCCRFRPVTASHDRGKRSFNRYLEFKIQQRPSKPDALAVVRFFEKL